ncbi:hypothetical protein M408DRAFT_325701 [Serendipita vermifera MAFF 305830]|uniref:Opi1-domain-containing protein n=1 Tax=Serendipita vermifera MAFF 305830 TaxID=933852 RepID=A0A0C2X859_SERVB|nr:hypothetical protein M408DRAFT_325701 [Serendipita vermifera MAFF 305830]
MDPVLSIDHNNSQEILINVRKNTTDEDNVRIAATALSDMRSGPGTANATPPIDQPNSRLPSVLNQAFNLYESSKANSRLVSYGANMVESGVHAISKPVLDRLPTSVLNYGRTDPLPSALPSRNEQQAMQVDTADRGSLSTDMAREEKQRRASSWANQQREARRRDSGKISAGSTERHGGSRQIAENEIMDEEMQLSPRDHSQDISSSGRQASMSTDAINQHQQNLDVESSSQNAVSRRGGWHTLMVEAGGISAAISDESMRKLKYCLEWLQWATSNLDTQITLLETFISSINATVSGEPISPSAAVSPEALQHYMSVKKNVVNTIRQVVEVVGKYAGGSLPEPAKEKVKGFILSLPGRWSVAVKDAGLGEGWETTEAEGGSSAEATSTARAGPSAGTNPRKRNRLESSTHSISSDTTALGSGTTGGSISAGPSSVSLAPTARSTGPGGKRTQLLPPTAGAARHAAHRVLTLAQESLHAVKGVTGVFKDTLDRADAWVERLRRVGYNRNQDDSDSGRLLPAPSQSSMSRSPSVSSPHSPLERRRQYMTPRELHLEALARSMPSVGPYGPYGKGDTPPMSPVLGALDGGRHKAFPFDNPAPGAPSYGRAGGSRKSETGLSAVPPLGLGEPAAGARSRGGSMSVYEGGSNSESLPPPSVVGSTSSVADDELEEGGEYESKHVRVVGQEPVVVEKSDEEGIEYRVKKRRKKEDELA